MAEGTQSMKDELPREVTTSTEIQEKMEEAQEIEDKTTTEQCSRDELDEYAEMDQTQIKTNQLQKQQTSNVSRIINQESRIVDHKFQTLNTVSRTQGIQGDELEYKIHKFIPNAESESDDLENGCAGKWSELMVVAQRPPWEPSDLYSNMVRQGEETMNEGGDWDSSGSKDGASGVDSRVMPIISSSAMKLRGTPPVTNHQMVVVPSSGGSLHGGWLRPSPIAAKPPSLMAAVFPWNRGRDDMAARQGEQERRVEEKVHVSDVLELW
ncbi:hypothetical protein PIB30_040089 [Stylosanthes scabra]|uniref:Uncharacterized protein n=1 Tax=Stylosanthes scabra TaxID=79078 RepID=A0ABU6YBW7_9FABA|nr:hypothetical protein [Stylosanthes scabra]